MQKDYWNISYRNFQALGILIAIFVVLLAFSVFTSDLSARTLISFVILVAVCALLFVISSLFKKRNPKAIVVANTYLWIILILSIVQNFLLSPPLDGIIIKIISLLIWYYLFINVRHASKQGITPAAPAPTPTV